MKRILALCTLLIIGYGFSSFNTSKVNLVQIKTSFGNMVIYLYDATPKHKENFIKLTKAKFFDGTTFHRCIKNFVIQGGDPNSKDNDPTNDGQGGPGYEIPAEINPAIKHKYGAVGAARDGNPEKKSNGSQFYIVVNQGGTHALDGGYTVFGEVVSGMDVAEKIASVPTDGANNRPLKNVPMTVTIAKSVKYDSKQLQAK
jgi:cyclophilin family peptidyl-prolyl cis-trans isomerase